MTRPLDLAEELGELIGGAWSGDDELPAPAPSLPAEPVVAFDWNEGQRAAIEKVAAWRADPHAPRFLSLTGPAGTGKTSVMQAVRQRLRGTRTAWAAMTGKAAARMKAASGVNGKTLHSVLYQPPREVDNAQEQKIDLAFEQLRVPDGSCLLVIDESSMIGPSTHADIERSAYNKVLLVGDSYQIPPVLSKKEEAEKGDDYSVFADVEGARLTEVMRSAGAVLSAATIVREQQQVPWDTDIRAADDSYTFMQAGGRDIAQDIAIESWLADRQDHAIITWRNESRMRMNRVIRARLGFVGEIPQPGESVIIRRNLYRRTLRGVGLMNGDLVTLEQWNGPGPTLCGHETAWMTITGPDGEPDDLLTFAKDFSGTRPYVPLDKWKTAVDKAGVEPVPITYGYALTGHMCVHPDTIVETPRGLMKISQLPDEGTIATPTGTKQFSHRVVNPSGVMLRIRTRDGYTLDVTPEHGVFVWDGDRYSRIEARELKPGLLIQFRLGETCGPTGLYRLPTAVTYVSGLDTRAVEHHIPAEVDGDFAEFVGMMVADGTLFDKGFRLVKRHRDVVLRFRELCEKIFGVKVNDENAIESNATGVYVMSVQIARWLSVLGGMSPKEKDVPSCILESPLEIQACFLRGLFEDGTVNLHKATGVVDHVEWSTCRESLAIAVHVMLLRFGIIASRVVRTNQGGLSDGPQQVLYIYGANARKFRDQIGFVSAWKQDRLTRYGGDSAETRYKAPFSSQEAQQVKLFLSESERSNLRERRRLSRHVMKKALARGANEEMRELLNEKLKWHHSAIVSIDRVEDAPSMCVTVPDGGRFLQNGSPQSNSQGSEWRRVTTVLPGDLSNPHFKKPTRLADGGRMLFAMRFLYTAVARARKVATLIVSS